MNRMREPVKQFFPYQVDSDGRPILQGILTPGVVVCHCVFLDAQIDFHNLLNRRAPDWDLPEEQFATVHGEEWPHHPAA